MAINAAGKATRRRALGRFLQQRGSQLSVMHQGLVDSKDLVFMTEKERKKFDKLAKQVQVVALHLGTLGSELDNNNAELDDGHSK